MAEEAGQGDRTEAATPRRRQRAREDGRAALSREALVFATLGTGGAVLWLAGPLLVVATLRRLAFLLQQAAVMTPAEGATAALWALALAALPVAVAVAVAAVAATFAQTGFLLHLGALMPNVGRISPRAGVRRLFGTDGLAEAGRGILKLVILLLACRGAVTALLPDLPALLWQQPAVLPGRLFAVILRLGLTGLCVQAGFAAVDLGWVRWRHSRSLRMSREDIRQEYKESEGDPAVKGRLKRLRLSRARRRMLSAVPTATVVVTNPTHYAVALFYQRAQGGAPRIVAKGMDHMATRIREAAQAHGVPLVANPPLARALYAVELDAEIPAEHFQTVAEIIAFVWRLDHSVRSRL